LTTYIFIKYFFALRDTLLMKDAVFIFDPIKNY
jgi:hypothetical protein